MNEFNKRIDPDLPFYYWIGVNEHFHLKALPSFNDPSPAGIERLDRVIISRRADPGVFVANELFCHNVAHQLLELHFM